MIPRTQIRAVMCSLLLLFAVLGQGCLVWRYPTTPKVTGSVIDATTKQPVSGARVGVRQHDKLTRMTSPDGSFRLRSDHVWRPCPLIPGDYWPGGMLFIEAPGYRPHEQKVHTFGGGTVVLQHPVELQREVQ